MNQSLWKEYLNSDGQEFHQYRERPRHMPFEVQVLDWEKEKDVARLNQVIISQASHRDNWISNNNTYI